MNMIQSNLTKAQVEVGYVLWLGRPAGASYRSYYNHPCIVIDLLEGSNGNESEVSVCVVSALRSM